MEKKEALEKSNNNNSNAIQQNSTKLFQCAEEAAADEDDEEHEVRMNADMQWGGNLLWLFSRMHCKTTTTIL